jgi:hypothetical protein
MSSITTDLSEDYSLTKLFHAMQTLVNYKIYRLLMESKDCFQPILITVCLK